MEMAFKGHRTVVVSYVLTSVAFFFLLLKLSTRFFVVGSPGLDDLLITCSFLLLIPLCMTMYYQAHFGMGTLSAKLSMQELAAQSEWFWASTWIYEFSFGLAKLSILTQYLRIFVYARTRMITYIMIAFMICYIIQVVLVGIFQCVPVEAFWDKQIKGQCINSFAWYYATAGLNIFSDVMIIIIPIPALGMLQIPKRQKFGLITLFAFGGFGCVTSMIRLYVLTQSTSDFSAENALAAMWSMIENCIAVILACITSLRPLLSHFLPWLQGLSNRGSDPSSSKSRYTFEPTSTASGRRFGLRRLVSKPNPVPYEDRKQRSFSEEGRSDHSAQYSEDVALESAQGPAGVEITHTLENYVTRATIDSGRQSRVSEQSDLAFARSLGVGGPDLHGDYRTKVSTSPV